MLKMKKKTIDGMNGWVPQKNDGRRAKKAMAKKNMEARRFDDSLTAI